MDVINNSNRKQLDKSKFRRVGNFENMNVGTGGEMFQTDLALELTLRESH